MVRFGAMSTCGWYVDVCNPVVAVLQDHQVHILGLPASHLLLLPDLIMISRYLAHDLQDRDQQNQHHHNGNSIIRFLSDLLTQTVDSDGLVQLMLQDLTKECSVLPTGEIFNLPAAKSIPATSRQLIALLKEIFEHPTEICRLLQGSEVFDGPYAVELFNASAGSAVTAVLRRCVTERADGPAFINLTQMEHILQTLCSIVIRSKGHLVVSATAVTELLSTIITGSMLPATIELTASNIGHNSNLISSLCSLPSAKNLPAVLPDDALLSLLHKVAAPHRDSDFVAVLKLVILLAGGKEAISSDMAAEILAIAQATQVSEGPSFAITVVQMEFPVLQVLQLEAARERQLQQQRISWCSLVLQQQMAAGVIAVVDPACSRRGAACRFKL